MSIVFNGPLVQYIPLTYLRPDALNVDKHVFQYPNGTDFSTFRVMYYYYNGVVYQVSSDAYYILPNNRIRLSIKNFYMGRGTVLKLLCDSKNQRGLDFVDRFGLSGTVYNYTSITVTNQSFYSRLTNVTITSEDLTLGFITPYPLQYTHIKYTNGVPNATLPGLSDVPIGIFKDSSRFIAFFNSVYAGQISLYGGITGYNTVKAGLLEVLYRGQLEFALSMSGPWYAVLTIPEIQRNQSCTCYIRCGQVITALARYLNSVKIFATEAV